MLTQLDFDDILRSFPPVEFAFAYGSGAIAQAGYDYSKGISELPMLDMVFVVNDTAQWHEENRALHSSHYSPLFPLQFAPSSVLGSITDHFGGAIWYNVDASISTSTCPNRLIKYGVISVANLMADLKDWKWLYVSGRLHKPVTIMKDNESIRAAMRTNYQSALCTSLLLQDEESTFSEQLLFRTVASLSYTGDPRMGVAENPNKIDNLVKPALDLYRALYREPLLEMGSIVDLRLHISDNGSPFYSQNLLHERRAMLVNKLPFSLRNIILASSKEAGGRNGISSTRLFTPSAIRKGLATIVGRAARAQSVKGLVTAGFLKSFSYLGLKIKKAFKGAK